MKIKINQNNLKNCLQDPNEDVIKCRILTENGHFVAVNSNMITQASVKVELDNTLLDVNPKLVVGPKEFRLEIKDNRSV